MNIKEEYRYQIPANKQIEIAEKYNSHQKTITNDNKRSCKNTPATKKGRFSGKIKALIAAGIIIAGTAITGSIIHQVHQEELTKIYSADIQSDIARETLEHAKEHLTIDDLMFNGQGFDVALPSNRINEYSVLQSTNIDEKLNEYFANPTDEAKSYLKSRKKDIANLNFNLIKASLADSLGCNINEISINFTDTALRIHSPKNSLEYWADNGKHNDNQISSVDAKVIKSIAEAYEEAKSKQHNLNIDKLLEHHANLKHILGEYNYTIEDNKLCLKGIDDSKLYKYSRGILGNKFIAIKEDEGPELE